MPTKNPPSQDTSSPHEQQQVEEDYIDMDLSSRISSPPQTKEFEFQILSPSPNHKEKNALFPADDLFYKGKLLPLLLPSRRQMLESDFTKSPSDRDRSYRSMPSTNTLNTPLDSCNISPSESCRVSCELSYNDDDYFFEWSNELTSFVNNHHHNNHNSNTHTCRKKLPWPKKLKLGNKLKASRAYLKSLFTKSGCSEVDPSAEENFNSGHNFQEIANESSKNIARKKPITIAAVMKGIDRDHHGIIEDTNSNSNNVQRRSFSGAIIKRHYPPANSFKCLSSSSSSGDSCSSFSNELRRSSSSATEVEGSIEAAIAHCKKSCEAFGSRDIGSSREVAEMFCSFSVSRNVNADQKRPGFCSI